MTQHVSEKNSVDIWMIRENLKLTYEQRVAQHQELLDCMDTLKEMMKAHHEQSAKSPQISDSKPA